MEEITTIQLERKTRDRLKTFKKYKRETYDELLNGLMDKVIGRDRE